MIEDTINYKDYVGSISFNTDDKVFFGKIEGIDDLVTFEGQSVPQLKEAFHEAVHDYIELQTQAAELPEAVDQKQNLS